MELQTFLAEDFNLKFLKWVEIILQEDKVVKLDAMYILVKDDKFCDVIFVDSRGQKRKVSGQKGDPGDNVIINFEIDENLHLIMQVETSSSLEFSLDNNGHLILNNN